MKYLIIALLNVLFFNFILCRSICDPSNTDDFSEGLNCNLSLSTNISQNLKTGDDCLIRDAQGACVSYKSDTTPPSTPPPPPSASASATTPASTENPTTSQAPVSTKSAESSSVHFDNKWIIAIVAAIVIIGGIAFCIWKPRYAQENCHCMC